MITLKEGSDGAVAPVDQRGRCEVAVQWERPQDECREVGVQVDLIGLSFTKPGSDELPWRCVSVRAEEPGGGALWHCCLHSPSAPSVLCPSANITPTKTSGPEPDSTETTLPSMQHSSPNLIQTSLSLPSMPVCGDSPSSPSPAVVDPPDPPLDPPASEPTPEAALEALGFMAPLSSDEEDAALAEHDGSFSAAEPPTKPRRRRRTNQKPPMAHIRRRNINARQAGLPLRYQQDYDLETRERASANHEPETHVKQEEEEKALVRPLYRQSPNLGEFGEFQMIARRQLEALQQEEPDLQINPSLISHPGFERFMPRPISPNRKQRLLPLKLKKASNKIRYWAVETAEEKEKMEHERSALASDGWSKDKTLIEGSEGTQSDEVVQGSGKASDAFRYEKIIKTQEGKEIWPKQSKNQHQNPPDVSSVQTEPGKAQRPLKRKPGRPRKIKVKQESFEVEHVPGPDVAVEAETERPSSAVETLDRPRRKIRVRPKRYLEPGEVEPEPEPGEVVEWKGKHCKDDSHDYGHFGTVTNGGVTVEVGVSGRYRLKLGDVHSGGEGQGGLVKKVQILSDTESAAGGERGTNGSQVDLEDIQDLFVLRGSEDDGWERRNGDGDSGWGSEERRRRRRRRRRERRDGETHEGIRKGLKRRAGFMVYRDEETGRTTFISPCFVKLQPLKQPEEQKHL